MSLGFLTESALLPSKAKEIKVDSKSILDLKAVVFQKEQERKERKRRLQEAVGGDDGGSRRRHRSDDSDARGKSVYARLKAKKQSREASGSGKNRGVDERRRRDERDRELDVDDEDDDAALQEKSRRMLEQKAKMYEQMMQGKREAVPAAAAKECLVNFDEKRRNTQAHEIVDDGEFEDETIEITDEFGRSRRVQRGSAAHLEYASSQQQPQPETFYFEDKRRQDSETQASGTTSGSFVVSQWEKTLKVSEKQFLEQVHAGVEQAKQAAKGMTDKQLRKKMRLEKLKQQQLGVTAVADDSSKIPQDSQVDREAAVKATAFLNQFTGLL